MAMCKGWFQIALSEVGSVRRVCSISHIATMCRQRYRSSEMNEAPFVPQAILVGDQHASLPAMVLSLSDPPTPPFFFRRAEPPRGLHYKEDGKSFFFGCGEGVMKDVTYHSTKLSGGLTLSS